MQQLHHEASGLCLEVNANNAAKLQMSGCDVSNNRQMWKFGLHKSSG